MAQLLSICIKEKSTNEMKHIGQVDLIKTGIPNDIHCDGGERQISILPYELIVKVDKDFSYGDFSENFVIKGLDYSKIEVGSTLNVGDASLKITKIGAKCSTEDANKKALFEKFIFAKVLVDGIVTEGDDVNIL